MAEVDREELSEPPLEMEFAKGTEGLVQAIAWVLLLVYLAIISWVQQLSPVADEGVALLGLMGAAWVGILLADVSSLRDRLSPRSRDLLRVEGILLAWSPVLAESWAAVPRTALMAAVAGLLFWLVSLVAHRVGLTRGRDAETSGE